MTLYSFRCTICETYRPSFRDWALCVACGDEFGRTAAGRIFNRPEAQPGDRLGMLRDYVLQRRSARTAERLARDAVLTLVRLRLPNGTCPGCMYGMGHSDECAVGFVESAWDRHQRDAA